MSNEAIEEHLRDFHPSDELKITQEGMELTIVTTVNGDNFFEIDGTHVALGRDDGFHLEILDPLSVPESLVSLTNCRWSTKETLANDIIKQLKRKEMN